MSPELLATPYHLHSALNRRLRKVGSYLSPMLTMARKQQAQATTWNRLHNLSSMEWSKCPRKSSSASSTFESIDPLECFPWH